MRTILEIGGHNILLLPLEVNAVSLINVLCPDNDRRLVYSGPNSHKINNVPSLLRADYTSKFILTDATYDIRIRSIEDSLIFYPNCLPLPQSSTPTIPNEAARELVIKNSEIKARNQVLEAENLRLQDQMKALKHRVGECFSKIPS